MDQKPWDARSCRASLVQLSLAVLKAVGKRVLVRYCTNSMQEALTSRKRYSTSYFPVYFPVTRSSIVMLDLLFSIASTVSIATSDWLS